ncbi:MAG TPA: TMEM175 family protein [bacterium]|nr:TMEM175 family protein [bacterium]
MNRNPDQTGRGIPVESIQPLADGVFAIVITLLVILIEPPSIEEVTDGLHTVLLDAWHMFLAYLVSFILLGIYWWRHHYIFHHLERLNNTLTWLTLFFLLFVAFIPFPTALLMEFYNTVHGELVILIFGGVNLIYTGLLFAMWSHAERYRLIIPLLQAPLIRRTKHILSVKAGLFAASMAIASLSHLAAVAIYLVIPLLYLFPWYRETHEMVFAESAT